MSDSNNDSSPLILVLVVGAVVVLMAAGGAFFLFFARSTTSTPMVAPVRAVTIEEVSKEMIPKEGEDVEEPVEELVVEGDESDE